MWGEKVFMLLFQDLLFVDFRGSVFKCNYRQTEDTDIVCAYSLWEALGPLQKWICSFQQQHLPLQQNQKGLVSWRLSRIWTHLESHFCSRVCHLPVNWVHNLPCTYIAICNSMYTFFIAFCLNLNFISKLFQIHVIRVCNKYPLMALRWNMKSGISCCLLLF